MSATPSELKLEDDHNALTEEADIADFNLRQSEIVQVSQHQSSEDIIEFLQSDTHKMHLIQTL